MDDNIRSKLDALIESEISQGFRILEVPAVVKKALRDARVIDPAIPDIIKVRLTRLNAKKRAQVSEVVLNRYHSDLANKNILSRNKILELNIERGEWSRDKDKEIERLQKSTGELMQVLTIEGINQAKWRQEVSDASKVYLEALDASNKHPDEKRFLSGLFTRWSGFTANQQEEYDALFAKEQGLPTYSPDWDLNRLYDTSPNGEASDALEKLNGIHTLLHQYLTLADDRQKLTQLLTERAQMFADSVETRRDNCEELARIYYGSMALDAEDRPIGPITASFDQFWEMPEEFITWLQEESYFFYNAVPQAIRKNLDDWGFTMAGRESGLLRLLGESPAPPSSKDDTTPPTETPADSSTPQA